MHSLELHARKDAAPTQRMPFVPAADGRIAVDEHEALLQVRELAPYATKPRTLARQRTHSCSCGEGCGALGAVGAVSRVENSRAIEDDSRSFSIRAQARSFTGSGADGFESGYFASAIAAIWHAEQIPAAQFVGFPHF